MYNTKIASRNYSFKSMIIFLYNISVYTYINSNIYWLVLRVNRKNSEFGEIKEVVN